MPNTPDTSFPADVVRCRFCHREAPKRSRCPHCDRREWWEPDASETERERQIDSVLRERGVQGQRVPGSSVLWYDAIDVRDLAGVIVDLRRRLRATPAAPVGALSEAQIAQLREALAPFAAMHREGCDSDEMACKRGVASDATFLFSRDFARAAEVLSASLPPVEGAGDWLDRFAVYAFSLDGFEALTSEQQRVCRDAVEWAKQRCGEVAARAAASDRDAARWDAPSPEPTP